MKTKKIVTNCLFLFSNNVDLKIIIEVTENHSGFSGWANSYNKFVSVDFDKP